LVSDLPHDGHILIAGVRHFFSARREMKKILVIDDDPLVRHTIMRILKHQGYEVLVAEDGARGIKIFRAHQPELVITDIIMPEQEGLETIRQITSEYPACKVIAISGGGRIGNFDFLDIAGKLGASIILQKPFDPAELLKCVTNCLSGV
jgi:two-component system chemotaxis response regulator CheY